MKQLISIRISDATKAKLDALTVRHGTQTEVIALAIDRLYQEEKGTMDTLTEDYLAKEDHQTIPIEPVEGEVIWLGEWMDGLMGQEGYHFKPDGAIDVDA